MKVEREEVFTPIVITLESQVEVDALVDLLYIGTGGSTNGNNAGTDAVGRMRTLLEEYSSDVFNFIYYEAPEDNTLVAK